MEVIIERIYKIKCELTPSHQSDILDTLMCEFELLIGKENIIHGDYEYANYHIDYKKNGILTQIKSFNMDIKEFLVKGGSIETMENKTLFTFPTTILNKGDKKRVQYCYFPLFVCKIKRDNINVDVECYPDWKNRFSDLKEHRSEFPELTKYL